MIHPSAIIEPGARLGVGCEIHAYAVVTRHAILGDRVVVHPGAVVGGDPQHLTFDRRKPSEARVGDDTVLREQVTINRAVAEGGSTVVGPRCFLMAGSHVGHDCEVGADVVLANNTMLAGHVTVGPFCFLGGGAGVHQHARLGESVMVSGLSRISRDLPPFALVAERDEVRGLNLVGLRRRGCGREAIRELKEAFRAVYSNTGDIRRLAAEALGAGVFSTAEARRFLEFFAGGKRGFARPPREGAGEGGAAEA